VRIGDVRVVRVLRRVLYWLAVLAVALVLVMLVVALLESNDVGKLKPAKITPDYILDR
jgi:hypothetical protein